MHRHTEHLREPLDSPLRGDSCALHHRGARASESQSTKISRSCSRSLSQAGFRNLKIIIKSPTRPPKSRRKQDPPPLLEDSTGWLPPPPASPQSVSDPFDLALPGWCTSRSRRCCCSPGFFPLLPPPPASLPLPLHPSRAGRRGGRGHPGSLIHSHCRNGHDVAFRREARPQPIPPPGRERRTPVRVGGPGAPSGAEGAGGRSGREWGGASRAAPHPHPGPGRAARSGV